MTKPVFFACVAAIAAAAAAVRLIDLTATLEYDEIWSLMMYAPLPAAQIITDLSLPNNHPINSLWLKCLSPAAPAAWLRLHVFAAGMAAILLTGVLARRWFNSRRAALFAMLWLAFSAPAAQYSVLARGYSLQLASLLLFALSLHDLLTVKRHPAVAVCGLWLGGAAAILSVSSSAMFLLPVGLAAIAAMVRTGLRQRGFRSCLLPGIVLGSFGLAALGWYLIHFEKLQQGMIWGTQFRTPGDFCRWLVNILPLLGIPVAAVAAVAIPAGFRRSRRSWSILLMTLLLPLLLAPVTRGGPARVYLPLTAVFALLYGGTAAWLLHHCRRAGGRRLAVTALLVLIPPLLWRTVLPHWRTPDWHAIHAAAETAPADTIIVYTATNNYPLVWNVPAAPETAMARLQHRAPQTLLLINQSDGINGMTADGSETVLPLPTTPAAPVAGLPAATVRLRECRNEPAPGTIVLAVIGPAAPADKLAACALLTSAADPLLILNSRLVAAMDLLCHDHAPALLLFRSRPAGPPLMAEPSVRHGMIKLFEVIP